MKTCCLASMMRGKLLKTASVMTLWLGCSRAFGVGPCLRCSSQQQCPRCRRHQRSFARTGPLAGAPTILSAKPMPTNSWPRHLRRLSSAHPGLKKSICSQGMSWSATTGIPSMPAPISATKIECSFGPGWCNDQRDRRLMRANCRLGDGPGTVTGCSKVTTPSGLPCSESCR